MSPQEITGHDAGPWFVELPSSAVLEMRGKEGLDLLQRISTNDLSKMAVGSWTRTVLTNERGRMIDILWVGKIEDDLLFLLSGTNSPEKSKEWIEKFIIMENVEISPGKDVYHRIDIVGNSDIHLDNSLVQFREEWGGTRILHLLGKEEGHDAVVESLTRGNIVRRSVQEYEDYRISRGIPSGGHEITLDYNPLEAGLEQLISWNKGCYIGQEVIARLDTYKKVQKHLVKFSLSGGTATVPARIIGTTGEIGTLTSVSSTAPFQGLGYVAAGKIQPAEKMFVEDGSNQIQVTVKE